MRTAQRLSSQELLQMGVLGINGEAGEIADLVKKNVFQGHSLQKHDLIEEVGDCLWYLAILCEGLNANLEDVAQANIDKLMKRYPNGFENKKSLERNDL